MLSSTVLARGERAAVVCEELAHGGPQGLCVYWVTLIFCEFGGAVAHGRSVTTVVLSMVDCGFCLVGCVCAREGGRETSKREP